MTPLEGDSADPAETTNFPVIMGTTLFGRNSADVIGATNLRVFIAAGPLEGVSSDSIGSGLFGPHLDD